MLAGCVLDGQAMQVELLGDRRQLLRRRSAVVQPHVGALVLQVLGDVIDREVLQHELALAVEPRVSHARTIWPGADPARQGASRRITGRSSVGGTPHPTCTKA